MKNILRLEDKQKSPLGAGEENSLMKTVYCRKSEKDEWFDTMFPPISIGGQMMMGIFDSFGKDLWKVAEQSKDIYGNFIKERGNEK